MDNLQICIGRQMGSGGRDIAKRLAKEFGCHYYDMELLQLASKRSGFTENIFKRQDESHGALKSLFSLITGRIAGATMLYGNVMSQESLFKIQSEVIWNAAEQGPCVFVGRCADYILRTKPMMVSVFITANEDERVRRMSEDLSCDAPTALKIIQRTESERASYYNYYTSKRWGAAESYNLCINSSILGIEGTAQFIAHFIRQRFPRNQ
jgi:cytidylate kinase